MVTQYWSREYSDAKVVYTSFYWRMIIMAYLGGGLIGADVLMAQSIDASVVG